MDFFIRLYDRVIFFKNDDQLKKSDSEPFMTSTVLKKFIYPKFDRRFMKKKKVTFSACIFSGPINKSSP